MLQSDTVLRPESQREGFLSDMGLAFRCWMVDPRLPLLSLGLVLAGFLPSLLRLVNPVFGALGFLVLPLSIFSIGFYGTQRIWYMRIFRGQRMEPSAVWSMSWRFLGRYLVLGIATGWPIFLLTVAYVMSIVSQTLSDYRAGHLLRAPRLSVSWLLVLVILASLLWDFALTFATPALAFTTDRATDALTLGLRMIRETWPAGALYVFFPPLALQVVSGIPGLAGVRSLPLIYGVTFVVAIFNLAAKGAVAAFYLRRMTVGDEGSLAGSR